MPSVHSAGPARLTRRELLKGLAAASLAGCAGCGGGGSSPPPSPPPDLTLPALTAAELVPQLERRAFDFFWETAHADTGLVPDRWPNDWGSSIASVGFALTAYCIGVERGYVTRAQALSRALTTARFFRDAPMGPGATGVTGYKGFYYHFLSYPTGHRAGTCELSPIDTALLLAGLLHAQAFFDGADAGETELRAAVDTIYDRIDWKWMQQRGAAIALAWSPEGGFLPYDWIGNSEGALLYLLALGAPTNPLGADAWAAWTSKLDAWNQFRTEWGQTYLTFPPLFGHQFPQCFIDLRGVQDPYMKAKGLDYFENTRRATLAQRAYAIANPGRFTAYGADVWGLTACDGPAEVAKVVNGTPRQFHAYSARGPGGVDDGTIAPYAAGSSLPHAPEIVEPALVALHSRYGKAIWGKYGFFAFNPTFSFPGASPTQGRLEPGFGWVNTDFLGIELGPLLAMIANAHGELVWARTRQHPAIKKGLLAAGFTGGWLG